MSSGIFNHVQIKVMNLRQSRKFYDAIMKVLGYNVVLEIEGVVIGYGTSVHDMFEIRQTTETIPLSKAVHIAFNATEQNMVDSFYLVALDHGGRCNGKPGLRPQYAQGYYAAFVIDPDGHNIEVVYMQKN